jgi:hypothetical protein
VTTTAAPYWELSWPEQLDECARLEHDWDSYGSDPPSPAGLANARALIEAALARFGTAATPVHIAPISGNGAQITWRGPVQEIEVDIDASGKIGTLWLPVRADHTTWVERHDLTRDAVLDLLATVLA